MKTRIASTRGSALHPPFDHSLCGQRDAGAACVPRSSRMRSMWEQRRRISLCRPSASRAPARLSSLRGEDRAGRLPGRHGALLVAKRCPAQYEKTLLPGTARRFRNHRGQPRRGTRGRRQLPRRSSRYVPDSARSCRQRAADILGLVAHAEFVITCWIATAWCACAIQGFKAKRFQSAARAANPQTFRNVSQWFIERIRLTFILRPDRHARLRARPSPYNPAGTRASWRCLGHALGSGPDPGRTERPRSTSARKARADASAPRAVVAGCN